MTGDSFDFDFLPTATTPDTMTIKKGRAQLGINELNCSTKCTYMPVIVFNGESDVEILVRKDATRLVAGVLGAMTAAAFLAF